MSLFKRNQKPDKPRWLQDALRTVHGVRRNPEMEKLLVSPLIFEQYSLKPHEMRRVFHAMSETTPDNPHPLLVVIRDHADREWLDAWAWMSLRWIINRQMQGAAAGLLTIYLLGFFVTDEFIFRLTPLMHRMMRNPGSKNNSHRFSFRQPAKFKMNFSRWFVMSLRYRSSDTVLLCLQYLRLFKSRYYYQTDKYFKDCLQEIAMNRMLAPEQLWNYAVYSGESDENGHFVLWQGNSRYTIHIYDRILLQDEQGKMHNFLPDSPVEDARERRRAFRRWRTIRQQIRAALNVQAVHLEQAMIQGQSWQWQDFEWVFLRHPMMLYLAQHLIWGTYDPAGQFQQSFRVDESGRFLDVEDDLVVPDTALQLRIVHPAELPETLRQEWSTVLMDYELIPPFAQMGRPVYLLSDAIEDTTDLLAQFDKKVLATMNLTIAGWQNVGGMWQTYFPGVQLYARFQRIRTSGLRQVSSPFGRAQSKISVEHTLMIYRATPNFQIYSPVAPEQHLRVKDIPVTTLSEILYSLHHSQVDEIPF